MLKETRPQTPAWETVPDGEERDCTGIMLAYDRMVGAERPLYPDDTVVCVSGTAYNAKEINTDLLKSYTCQLAESEVWRNSMNCGDGELEPPSD